MMNEKVLSVEHIPLVKVKELLKELAKEGELTYEQSLTLKYADKFSKLPKTKTDKLLEELNKFSEITNETAIKLADLLPQNEEILSLVLGKEIKISDEDKAKMLKLIKSYYTVDPKAKKGK